MLKEEDLEKKRFTGLRSFLKRTAQFNDETPKKIPRIDDDLDENRIYELPVVCICIVLINFYYC